MKITFIYYKDHSSKETPFKHDFECADIEQALNIAKITAQQGESCVIVNSEDCDFEGKFKEFRADVLETVDNLYSEVTDVFRKYEVGMTDKEQSSYQSGYISGISHACSVMFDLLRKYH